MSLAKRKSRPRLLTPGLDSGTYRASMRAELQKFGRDDEPTQLALFEEPSQKFEVKSIGLDLSISENKALSAVQKLLDKTNYKGNQPGTEIASSSFKWSGVVPKLSFTWTEYFEAYGLDEYQQRGRQRDEARKALLEGLTRHRLVCYERKRHIGSGATRKVVVDIIRTTSPLVKFLEYFEGVTESEARQVEAGEAMTERCTRSVLEVSPLLVDGVESFFLLKPASLHQEIEQLSTGKRTSRAVSLFIEWLLTKNRPEVTIHTDTLAIRLRKARLLKQRKRRELDSIIQECLETARTLGYLLSHTIEAGGLLRLQLNAERCLRVKSEQPEEQDAEENSRQPQ